MAWYDREEQDRRAEERRQYENDVFYDVWRSGGNPDAIDYDRADDARRNGASAQAHAQMLLREAAERRQRRRDEELQAEEAAYYAAMEAERAQDPAGQREA